MDVMLRLSRPGPELAVQRPAD